MFPKPLAQTISGTNPPFQLGLGLRFRVRFRFRVRVGVRVRVRVNVSLLYDPRLVFVVFGELCKSLGGVEP